jgi:hypothetical protein
MSRKPAPRSALAGQIAVTAPTDMCDESTVRRMITRVM